MLCCTLACKIIFDQDALAADSKMLLTACDDMHSHLYDVEHASLVEAFSGDHLPCLHALCSYVVKRCVCISIIHKCPGSLCQSWKQCCPHAIFGKALNEESVCADNERAEHGCACVCKVHMNNPPHDHATCHHKYCWWGNLNVSATGCRSWVMGFECGMPS